jgi:CRISPR/Cas system-associated protein Csm6
MRSVLISTVGASLIGNISYSDNSDLKRLLETKNAKGMAVELCKVSPDERLCGAEINSINSIVEKGYLAKRSVLKLLTSDTENGRFIGELLSHYFKNSGKSELTGLKNFRTGRFGIIYKIFLKQIINKELL